MLTPHDILREFGSRAAVCHAAVQTLFDALGGDDAPALAGWMPFFGRWAGRAIDKLPKHLTRLATRHGIAADAADSARLLCALQSYYTLVVKLVAKQFSPHAIDSLPGNPFSWCESSASPPVRRLVEQLGDGFNCRLSENDPVPFTAPSTDECDLFKQLYQDIFPRPLRRQLGEYYTPDWLAAHVLDQVGYTGQPDQRLLDPACGSGTFLMMALRRLRQAEGGRRKGEGGELNATASCRLSNSSVMPTDLLRVDLLSSSLPLSHSPSLPLSPIVGFDLNPLAVMTARANYVIALADVLPKDEPIEVPIYLYDSILGKGEGEDCLNCLGENGTVPFGAFDFIVGNPPWIAWDNLPDEDRQATKPLWERYGLFSLSGNEARHGGGKKDLSMLMLYVAADRYMKPTGRLGMVITQTLFQTKGAGDGFRRFRLGPDGPALKVLRVDDMVALRPFGDASNWTSTIVLEKGAETAYPVPYFKWKEAEGGRRKAEGGESTSQLSSRIPHLSCDSCFARPVDPAKPTSPWFVFKQENGRESTAHGASLAPLSTLPADYVARLGANSGGANGVYWLEVLGEADGGVLIRNLASRGKHRIEIVEEVIEPDLLYPLLRWGDVRRYSAVPKAHLLLAQDPATRSGIGESIMRAKYPRTLAYLQRFRDLLTSRAAYRRYQQTCPFYSMYNVGPYTVAPIKAVWRRMDRQINAAVVESADIVGLRRPMIPQETCVLVACETSDEAHYLCAMLNSKSVNETVAAHSVRGGKGFGTPGMFDFLPLRRYRPDDPRHLELASLSRQAHVAPTTAGQRQIDELARQMWSD
jgi:hypothetical protein